MKQELKKEWVIPYLASSLKVIMEGEKCNVAWMSTKHIAVIRPNGNGEYKKIKWEYAHLNIKLLLRPLSDLVKADKDCGVRLSYLISHGAHSDFWTKTFNVKYVYQHDLEILLKHHYDVFKLIDAGLAISIDNSTKEKTNVTC